MQRQAGRQRPITDGGAQASGRQAAPRHKAASGRQAGIRHQADIRHKAASIIIKRITAHEGPRGIWHCWAMADHTFQTAAKADPCLGAARF